MEEKKNLKPQEVREKLSYLHECYRNQRPPTYELVSFFEDYCCAAESAVVECTWKKDEDGNYETGCGQMFIFFENGPEENGFKHCPYCGLKITGDKK